MRFNIRRACARANSRLPSSRRSSRKPSSAPSRCSCTRIFCSIRCTRFRRCCNEDVESADRMVARLGDFLRLTLDHSENQEVTLEQELEFLRCYLDIELTRFQDRLGVDLEIAPDTLTAHVPNLILQPIVENAIRHGIAVKIEPGSIRISSERHG